MPDYYLEREDELAVNEEVTYGTSPGNPVAGDFFKHTSSHVSIVPQLGESYRDRDRDTSQASVLELQTGRERADVGIECDLIPSGDGSTPTAPDVDKLLKAIFGASNTRSAHTTTAAGSSGTTLNLAVGGGAASGLAAGDLFAVDVDATEGVEVRQCVSIATDTVTMDRALTADPASGRAVSVGTTYVLTEATLLSLHLWLFNNEALRYKVPGVVLNELDLSVSFADEVPMGKCRFVGLGQPEETHSVSRPTPTTAGSPLVPSTGKIWLGATKYPIIASTLNVKNGIELRNNESDALKPTGVKRTGNNSRYLVEQSLELYLTDSTKSFYDNSKTRTAIDGLIQLGTTIGSVVAWRLPNWKPKGERTSQDGEIGLRLAGRALGSSGDDEVRLAFI